MTGSVVPGRKNQKTSTRRRDGDSRRAAGKQQEFLDFVLDHYVKQGMGELDRKKLPHLLELKYHAVSDAVANLGQVAAIREMFIGLPNRLYAQQAVA